MVSFFKKTNVYFLTASKIRDIEGFLVRNDYLCILIARIASLFFIHLTMDSDKISTGPLMAPSLSGKLISLIITFCVMIIIVGLPRPVMDLFCGDERTAFLVASLCQSVFAFIFPAWLTARLFADSPRVYLGFSTCVKFRQFAGVIILMTIMTPLLNAIVAWNAGISLPDSLHGIEQTLRTWEDNAARVTSMILGDTSVLGLVSGILVIGIVTGLAEETFFRAGIQKAMTSSGINAHVAVWTAAFVFSAVHFQFFGFVPRLPLGALFGYLYYYTGSLWVSAFAHALNNSAVVLVSWLEARGCLTTGFDEIGVTGKWSVLILISSIILTLGFLLVFWHKMFHPIDGKNKKSLKKAI